MNWLFVPPLFGSTHKLMYYMRSLRILVMQCFILLVNIKDTSQCDVLTGEVAKIFSERVISVPYLSMCDAFFLMLKLLS